MNTPYVSTTSTKVDDVINQLETLNEMEVESVLEFLPQHLERHYSKMARVFVDKDRIEELENEITNLEDDIRRLEDERDNATNLHDKLVQGIKNLMP